MINKWLQDVQRKGHGLKFEVYDIVEKNMIAKDVINYLSKQLINHFISLEQLQSRFEGRPQKELKDYISKKLFAPDDTQIDRNVRQGDWGESMTTLVATDLRNHNVPAFKLRYKMNRKKSLNGLDVLALESDNNGNYSKIILYESKSKITYDKKIGIKVYRSLRDDSNRALTDMIDFLSKRCFERQEYDLAQKFDNLERITDKINKEYHAVIIMEKSLWKEDILKKLNEQSFDFNKTFTSVLLVNNLKELIDSVYSNTEKVALRFVYGN